MLQLDHIASEFLDMRIPYLADDNLFDERVLGAVHQCNLEIEERKRQVSRWLARYGVLRIPGVTGLGMAEKIIAFADTQKLDQKHLSRMQIKDEFRRLESALRVGYPSLSDLKHQRSIQSLTSKALWCLYPEAVPILDEYAERALMVLTRLCRLSAPPSEVRYEMFVDSWFLVYDQIKDTLAQLDKDIYLYDVRFMDRFLWWLGQPSFENFEKAAPESK